MINSLIHVATSRGRKLCIEKEAALNLSTRNQRYILLTKPQTLKPGNTRQLNSKFLCYILGLPKKLTDLTSNKPTAQ